MSSSRDSQVARLLNHIKVVELQLDECKRELETSKKLNVAQSSLIQHMIGENDQTIAHLVSQRDKAEHNLAICRGLLGSVKRDGLKHWFF